MENIVNLTKINKINKVMWHVNLFSWIEIHRGLNIFVNAYLKTVANKYYKIYWQKIYLSKYILKHVLVNIFDPFDISYTIYIHTHTCALCSEVPN